MCLIVSITSCFATCRPTRSPATSGPTVSAAPTNCPTTPDQCQAHVCVSRDNRNLALVGRPNSHSFTARSTDNGPIDGSTLTTFANSFPYGSTFESRATYVAHWWEVDLLATKIIAQVKIFACQGPLCHPEGTQLDQVRIDIYDGAIIVASFSFFYDQGPVLDIVLPFEVEGRTVRVTKMALGSVLSLNEVEVIGRDV